MSESDAQSWTPPTTGVFCWIEIPATDVSRAKKFYADSFNWTFRADGNPQYPADKIAFFSVPDPKFPVSGGIVKIPEDCHTKGKGAVKLYVYAEHLEATMEKIVKAGGTKQSEVEKEGDIGLMMAFDDSEGNRFGIWTVAKN